MTQQRSSFLIAFAVGASVSLGAACVDTLETQSDFIVDHDGTQHVERNADLIDRAGRPEVNIFVVRKAEAFAPHNRFDAHNLPGAETKAKFVGALSLGIAFWDSLDHEVSWSDEARAAVAETLWHDFLVVDPSKPCSVDDDTFFEIERSPVGRHRTCGGRTPNGDAIDRLISMLISGVKPYDDKLGVDPLDTHGDNVDAPARPATDSFPYLSSPHPVQM